MESQPPEPLSPPPSAGDAILGELFELAPDAMLVCDSAGRIVLANRQAETLFGYARRELVGQSIDMLVPERSRGRHAALRKDYASHPRFRPMASGFDLWARRKDGSVFASEISLSPLSTGGGGFVASAVRDVTDRRKAAEALRRLNAELESRVSERTRELEAAVRELEGFASSVSHDLRGPLRAIDALANILVEEHGTALPEEVRETLGTIIANVSRMEKLIEDLLRFARLGREPLNRQAVDLAALVRQACTELEPTCRGRSIEWSISDVPECEADPALIRQVILNLLSNAIKYTLPRPTAFIEFGARVEAGETIYFVNDNGVGFDMNHSDKLFAVFQRLHRQDEFEGSGVGLAIVHNIVTRHGGRAWAESREGSGATFYFTLAPAIPLR